MPIVVETQVWINGELVPSAEARISVFDHGLLYGDGVFEGIRAYHGRVLKLRTHLKRLYNSARYIGLKIPYRPDQLGQALRDTLEANDKTDGYVRLCVTRGVGTLGLNPYRCDEPTTFIIVDNIALYPQAMYEHGMAVITASTIRNHPEALSPRVKSMNYLNNIMAKIEAINAGVAEAIMVNHLGFVSECTAENLFLVRRNGETAGLITPSLNAGILEGITRNLVIELAEQAGYEVRQTDVSRYDVYSADEMFLTGTAAEVLPVTKVDARPIGDGKVGPVTRQMIEAFGKLRENAPED